MKKFKALMAGATATAFGFAGSVQAAVPTEATDAITGIQTDGEAMIAAGWPVLAALTGGYILIKVFKKVINKVA